MAVIKRKQSQVSRFYSVNNAQICKIGLLFEKTDRIELVHPNRNLYKSSMVLTVWESNRVSHSLARLPGGLLYTNE